LKIIFYIILNLIFCRSISAEQFYTLEYKTKAGDTFSSILKSFVKDNIKLTSKSVTVLITLNKNAQVKNWSKLPPEQKIKLYFAKSDLNLEKYNAYKYKDERLVQQISITFLPSSGYFKQSKNGSAAIKYRQVSPAALNLNYRYQPNFSKYSFNSGLYFSYLLPTSSASDSNISGENKVNIPPEIGGNFYVEYKFNKTNYLFYSGIDAEKFSSFNVDAITTTNQLYIDQHSVIYFTVGILKKISLNNKIMVANLSMATSVLTTYNSGSPTLQSNEKITGYKITGNLSYELTPKFFISSLAKYQSFSGDMFFSSLRLGLGLGYNFF
jgi:hypothetical protein